MVAITYTTSSWPRTHKASTNNLEEGDNAPFKPSITAVSAIAVYTLSSPATVVHKDAKELRDSCRELIAIIDHATVDAGKRVTIDAGTCLGIIQGVVDGFAVAAERGWEVPTSLKACVPEKASTGELIRVFLKYIDGHPETLSYAAADIVWQAMIASYPCHAGCVFDFLCVYELQRYEHQQQ